MEHPQFSLIPLFIAVGVSFAVPIVLSRFRGVFIPVIVGEILAGIAIGRSGLGLVGKSVVLEILSTLGFIFLMFLSGLEINFSSLLKGRERSSPTAWRRITGSTLFLSTAYFVLALLFSLAAGAAMTHLGMVESPWIMALILSTTSLGVVVPVLKQKGFTDSAYGQLMLGCSLVADFASIFLISIYVLFHQQGLSAEVLLILLLLAVFAGIYRMANLFQKHLPANRFFEEISSATSQIKLRGSLALALFFVVLARTVGSESILGAFLAGVIVSMLAKDEGSALRDKLDAIGYGFFIPIFFVMVGVEFDLLALVSSRSALVLLPVMVFSAYAVKIFPAAIFLVAYSRRDSLAAATLLSSRLSLVIAAAAIGMDLGLISEAVNASVILTALITCVLSPAVFKALAPEPEIGENHIVLVGCRNVTQMLAARLEDHGFSPKSICSNTDDRHPDAEPGGASFKDRKHLKAALESVDAEKAKTLVVLENRDEDSLLVCRMARRLFRVKHIIAWSQNPHHAKEFSEMNVQVVNPALSTVLFIESMILSPDVAGDLEGVEMRQIKLKSSRMGGLPLREIKLPEGVTLIAIERNGGMLVPDNDTYIGENDTLSFTGTAEGLKKVVSLFQPETTLTGRS